MTRRHIEAIAAAIDRTSYDPAAHYATVCVMVRAIADALEGINPGFDRGRFLRDCGVTV